MSYKLLKVVHPLPAAYRKILAQIFYSYYNPGRRELTIIDNTSSLNYYFLNDFIGDRSNSFKVYILKSFVAVS